MRTLARELVALQPDALFAVSTPAVAALLGETRAIPIVFARVADPVGSGFVGSLAKPNGNVTGFINFERSLAGKWLQLLKDIAPGLARVTLMFNPEKGACHLVVLKRPGHRVGPKSRRRCVHPLRDDHSASNFV
jgi:putative ABC transport system substrate-binding protein